MPHGRLSGSVLCGALLFPLTFSTLIARADVYHAVAAGDTLSSVARKYHVQLDVLRAANNLKDTAEAAPLGAMLLRVPGVNEPQTSTSALQGLPIATAVGLDSARMAPTDSGISSTFGASTYTPANYGSRNYSAGSGNASNVGVLGKAMVETVRQGDTWEVVAARYQAAGHDVTAETLRRRNNYTDLPAPGGTIIVPLAQAPISVPAGSAATAYTPRTSFSSVAQTAPPAADGATYNAGSGSITSNGITSTMRTLDGGVVASGEVEMPFAHEALGGEPVYQAPNSAKAVSRGNLGSRGGFGVLTRGGAGAGDVRILTPNEEATAPPAPQGRATSQTSTLAHVAQVASVGARIRRLPEASAATLYNCAVGTQLAILKENNGWSAILMSDRSVGWVPSRYLHQTSQTVDVSTQIVANPGPGGQVTGFARSYAGENPMVAQALAWLGTPYHYGGTGRRGIDCSSLVQHAFAACGYSLPRTAAQQASVGSPVDPANLHSGDRLYFSASGSRIDHTGLYMGNGLFVHASGSGRQVMVSNLFEPRNWNIFVGARR